MKTTHLILATVVVAAVAAAAAVLPREFPTFTFVTGAVGFAGLAAMFGAAYGGGTHRPGA